MRRVLTMLALALAVSGCSSGMSYVLDEYTGVEVTSFQVGSLDDGSYEDVYRIFDKAAQNKLMITPSVAKSAGIGFASGASFHAVDTTPPKPVFERAARQYLESTGRRCRILDAYLLVTPQWEVKYDCSVPPPIAPLAEAKPRRR